MRFTAEGMFTVWLSFPSKMNKRGFKVPKGA